MSKPAARVGDSTSHLFNPLVPGPGAITVLIEGKPAWRAVVDTSICPVPIAPPAPAPHGPEKCYLGSFGVLINGQMAVRLGDMVVGPPAPPNAIVFGAMTVLIGDTAFGLADPANIAAFCKGFKELMKKWDSLTPEQRRQELQNLINNSLTSSGTPPVTVNPTGLPAGTAGQFDFTPWNLDIDQNLMGGSLSPQQASDLADTVYHEARHAEQWYAMAQRQAAAVPSPSASQLSNAMGIPQSVAQQAVNNPLSADTPQGVFGDAMNRSVYGDRSAYRGQVLNSGTYDEYRALPEEIDAWNTGGATGGCP
jgi:uncharacterized Zn-binding protein involved in type VI secretion